jgi:hypothetical protein
MLCLLILAWAAAEQTLGIAMPLDATAVKVGAPVFVAELDLGKLKGDLRQIGWSPDGSELYIQTVEGAPPADRRRHYLVPSQGGVPASVDRQPDWAQAYGHSSRIDADGRLMLLDQERRKQIVAGVKDAMLPAWSTDGGRLAHVQKSGRRKFRLMWLSLTTLRS